MQTSSFLAVVFGAVAVHAGTVQFYTGTGCPGSATHTYRFDDCNRCLDPPGNFGSIRFSDIAGNRRVTVHNQDRCTSASQVGQGYGPACWRQGATSLRSAWVSCDLGLAASGNTTESDGQAIEAEVTPEDLANVD
ncbi:hypothetical protein BDV98DRAFT_537756 [Pterulicium gracile]|uniref:Uncharacterized protein n=1 Tax=Pterulicium gracile TaxID=1884261 RepID=A0A5C3Q1E8_9AGAR|nr:hypothetical protein BDV98DRAFT_537756 [Pterula gracilis]